MKRDTLVSPRNYQGKAPIIGMSDEEAKNIDEHDNAIPKEKEEEVVVKKDIPNISMDNNLQTATGGTRHKASASKRTPDPLPKVKKEEPKTMGVRGKEEDKPKPQDIDKKPSPGNRSVETLENLKDSKQKEFSTSGPKDSKDVKKYNKKIQRLNKKIDRKN